MNPWHAGFWTLSYHAEHSHERWVERAEKAEARVRALEAFVSYVATGGNHDQAVLAVDRERDLREQASALMGVPSVGTPHGADPGEFQVDAPPKEITYAQQVKANSDAFAAMTDEDFDEPQAGSLGLTDEQIRAALERGAFECAVATAPPGAHVQRPSKVMGRDGLRRRERVMSDPVRERAVVDAFHRIYYDEKQCFHEVSWMGVPIQKYPTDLFVYGEILHRCGPQVVLETGTNNGGSAHLFATLLEVSESVRGVLSKRGDAPRVVTVDLHDMHKPQTRGDIVYLHGSSTNADVLAVMASHAMNRPTMVVLDSDHGEAHVLEELFSYAPFVTPGQYLVVEDTNVNGHPVNLAHGPGPWEAVARFLETTLGRDFKVDAACEKLLLTANPRGYLRRIR